jgi:hypothetical protein
MCFPLDFIKTLLILAVIVVAVIGILQLLVPYIIGRLGVALGQGWAVVVGAFRIFIWAMVAIVVILICFELISCLLSFTGGIHFTR